MNKVKVMNPNQLRSLVCTVLMGLTVSAFGQDLLAEQAPLDKQMARIDSVVLTRLIQAEKYEYPADDLYPEWSNEYAHKYTNVVMPDSLVIDLTGFCMPTENTKVNDIFGYRPRRRRMHYGLDVKVERGDTIRSAFDGKVRYVSYQRRGYGHYVVIRHPNGLETLYAHLTKSLVAENEVVKAGDPIGLGGNTGRSTGSHLHFETILLGKCIDPALLFDFKNQTTTGNSYVYRKPGSKYIENGKVKYAGPEPKYHKVKKGDTIERIARKHGVSQRTIMKLNGLNSRSILHPGQNLRYQ